MMTRDSVLQRNYATRVWYIKYMFNLQEYIFGKNMEAQDGD